MKEFFYTYQSEIIWIVIVVTTVVVLRFITKIIHRWIVNKEEVKFPGEKHTSVNIVKHILNALWIVSGVIAISLAFVEKEKGELLVDQFKMIFYLGMVAVLTITAAATVNIWFRQSIKKKILNNDDPTSFKFLRYVLVFSIYVTGTLFGLLIFPSLRGMAQTALGGAGVIAIVAGIASQEALSNVIGGIFIISFKPFKIGDYIKVTDSMVGKVMDITLRHTVIRNFENKMIVIPNAIINKEKLINFDLGDKSCCEHVEMGISYDSDVKLAKKIMREVCEKHPLIIDTRSKLDVMDGQPIVRTAMTKINDSTLTIRAWAWCKNFEDSFALRCDVNESIKERFDAEGIDLAFPTRTITLSKDTINDVVSSTIKSSSKENVSKKK